MFYEVGFDLDSPAEFWYNDRIEQHRTIVCAQHPEHQRATRSAWSLSLEMKRSKVSDFMRTVVSEVLVTDKVAEAFQREKLTGCEFRPVDVCNRELGYKLWELVPTGKGGEAHPDSGIVRTYRCECCGRTRYRAFKNGVGIIVDENNWDGSDIFTITAYPRFILVTEKVKALFEKERWKGVLLTPSTELERDEYYGDEVSAR